MYWNSENKTKITVDSCIKNTYYELGTICSCRILLPLPIKLASVTKSIMNSVYIFAQKIFVSVRYTDKVTRKMSGNQYSDSTQNI